MWNEENESPSMQQGPNLLKSYFGCMKNESSAGIGNCITRQGRSSAKFTLREFKKVGIKSEGAEPIALSNGLHIQLARSVYSIQHTARSAKYVSDTAVRNSCVFVGSSSMPPYRGQ